MAGLRPPTRDSNRLARTPMRPPTRAETPDRAARQALRDAVRVLDAPRARVRATAGAFAAICDEARGAGRGVRRADLATLVPLLRATLAALPPGVDGTGVVATPGLLEDGVLWLEWWRRGPGGGAERLEVVFDPDHPAHFDYPEAEWFAVPHERDVTWIAGPFVDCGGTNRHLCTYTVPVHGAGGRFLGVAGVDLRVGYLERVARRALSAIDGRAVLVNRDARVVASNAPDLPAGSLLDPPLSSWIREDAQLPAAARTVAWDRDLPWGVVVLPSLALAS